MKSITQHIQESIDDVGSQEIFQWLWEMDDSVLDDLVFSGEMKERWGVDLDTRELRMIGAFMKWCHSPLCNIKAPEDALRYFKSLSDRRKGSFISAGSEGMVFGYEDYIIKVFFDIDSDPKSKEVYQKWYAYKGQLETIPHILRMGKDCSYIVLPRLVTPVPEGKILEDVASTDYLFDGDIPERQMSWLRKYSDEEVEWAKRWCDEFLMDYKNIMGPGRKMSNDVRSLNIGKDPKTGKILCFDWYNSLYDSTPVKTPPAKISSKTTAQTYIPDHIMDIFKKMDSARAANRKVHKKSVN